MVTYQAVNQTNFIRLENVSDNHGKFYRLQLVELVNGDFLCSTNWGRIGSDGTYKNYSFSSEAAARSKAESLIAQKQGRAYRIVGDAFLRWSSKLSKARTPEGRVVSTFDHELQELQTRSQTLVGTFEPVEDNHLATLSFYLLEVTDGRWFIKIKNHTAGAACQIISYLSEVDALRRVEQETREYRERGYRQIQSSALSDDESETNSNILIDNDIEIERNAVAAASEELRSLPVCFDVEERKPQHRLGRASSPEKLITVIKIKSSGRWAVDRYDCALNQHGYSHHDRENLAVERAARDARELQRQGYKEIPLASTSRVAVEQGDRRQALWTEHRFDGSFATVVERVNENPIHEEFVSTSVVVGMRDLIELLKDRLKHYGWSLAADSSIEITWNNPKLQQQIDRDEDLQTLLEELREIVKPKPKSRFTTWL